MRAGLIASAILALALACTPAAAAGGGPAYFTRCHPVGALSDIQAAMPNLRATYDAGKPITIVALGSSSTAGSGASSPERAYPAVLEADLRQRLPNADITVLNKGVGGQSSHDMLMRIDTDVLDVAPQLVIWQTGVNDAIKDVGTDVLARTVKKGIKMMRGRPMDLVLMDLQWLPREDRYPRYQEYRDAMARVADQMRVPLFLRHKMMAEWASSKLFTEEELVGVDNLHMVDASYQCLASRMADVIVDALTGPVKQN